MEASMSIMGSLPSKAILLQAGRRSRESVASTSTTMHRIVRELREAGDILVLCVAQMQDEGRTIHLIDTNDGSRIISGPTPEALRYSGCALIWFGAINRLCVTGGAIGDPDVASHLQRSIDLEACSECQGLNPQTGRWDQLAELGNERRFHKCYELDGKLLALGGMRGVAREQRSLEAFDGERWKPLPSVPSVPQSVEVCQGELFVRTSDGVEAFDPRTACWRSCDTIPSQVDASASTKHSWSWSDGGIKYRDVKQSLDSVTSCRVFEYFER